MTYKEKRKRKTISYFYDGYRMITAIIYRPNHVSGLVRYQEIEWKKTNRSTKSSSSLPVFEYSLTLEKFEGKNASSDGNDGNDFPH